MGPWAAKLKLGLQKNSHSSTAHIISMHAFGGGNHCWRNFQFRQSVPVTQYLQLERKKFKIMGFATQRKNTFVYTEFVFFYSISWRKDHIQPRQGPSECNGYSFFPSNWFIFFETEICRKQIDRKTSKSLGLWAMEEIVLISRRVCHLQPHRHHGDWKKNICLGLI